VGRVANRHPLHTYHPSPMPALNTTRRVGPWILGISCPMPARAFLAARVSESTLQRYRACLALARAVDDGATADTILSIALRNAGKQLRARCRAAGVSPDSAMGAIAPTRPFNGVPRIRRLL